VVALLLKTGGPRLDSGWNGKISSGLFFISPFTSPKIPSQKCVRRAIPLQAWTAPDASRRLRLPDFKTIGT